MNITLYGCPITKKNSQRIVHTGQYYRILPSKQYKRYEADCLAQITGDMRQNIDAPVNLKAVYYMPTRRKVDLGNLNAALHDILVDAGVLVDDNRDVVAGHDGSRVFYDKDNPRVEVEITPMVGYKQWAKK